MDLSVLQSEHREWLSHNFPDQTDHQGLLGVAEEVGELCHAHLKYEQGIRRMTAGEFREKGADAIGDIVIYLTSYCNTNGFDLDECVQDAWKQVQMRDWRANPEDGGF